MRRSCSTSPRPSWSARPAIERENIEDAIDALERSLGLDPDPRERHASKLALANALGLRVRGDKADNLERAIALVDEVVSYREQHETAERQAAAHNSRGVLYGRRIRGGRADNIEQAIMSDRRALDIYTRRVTRPTAPDR